MNHEEEEDVRRDEQREALNKRTAWHTTTVSWGQLVIALVSMVMVLIFDRLGNEKRITVTEERIASILRRLDLERGNNERFEQKLDDIRAQVQQIIVELTRHQATSEERGLRVPRQTQEELVRETWKRERANGSKP